MVDTTVIIAVDGPAASGKGTLARGLADYFGLRHIDSGKLYRATAWRLLQAGSNPNDGKLAQRAASSLAAEDIDAQDLLDESVGQAASLVAKIPEVRAALLERQRALAKQPPGTVVDGRDIGTVVFPDATYKFFVTASLDCRARRRWRELRDRGKGVDLEVVKRDLAERDARDQSRILAPLIPADDAMIVDTTNLDIDGALAAALAAIASTTDARSAGDPPIPATPKNSG